MKRNILLIEPNYKNKYPPIGLMKIATYHRRLGDNVTFFKGDLKDLAFRHILEDCIEQLKKNDSIVNWYKHYDYIREYILKRDEGLFDEQAFVENKNKAIINNTLKYYRKYYCEKTYYQNPRFDRVYVTTLFTFYFKITVKTINQAKKFVKSLNELKVGGVAASLIPELIEEATEIKPFQGLLDKPNMLDKGIGMIVDELPLDYSILDEIDYHYPTESAYFTFMTKGCTRKCAFCAVPKLEPVYKPKVDSIDKFNEIKRLYGDQRNLLLMDNNVLASPKFAEVIQEIKELGFKKGAKFIEPNQLNIAIQNLKNGLNDRAYERRTYHLLQKMLKRLKGERKQSFYNILFEYELLNLPTTTKENLLKIYPDIKDVYEKYRNKAPKMRYVDFNQGTDCRYVTDDFMKLMSEIPIRPLRIAFDYIGLKKKYVKAVNLAAKYEIKELSNYLLYNFVDKPVDLYERLQINVGLSENLGIHIYSFPMKYIPLYNEEATNRSFIGKNWNKKFIRAIQSILNVTKGIVAPGRSFFEKAFGRNKQDYFEILYMPETYIIYRKVFEVELGYTKIWKELFYSLTPEEFEEVKPIIETNDFKNYETKTTNPKLLALLQHYTIKRGDISKFDKEYKQLKYKFDKLIKKEQHINLTLTYDFENSIIRKKH